MGVTSEAQSTEEGLVRAELAAAYNILDYLGLGEGMHFSLLSICMQTHPIENGNAWKTFAISKCLHIQYLQTFTICNT